MVAAVVVITSAQNTTSPSIISKETQSPHKIAAGKLTTSSEIPAPNSFAVTTTFSN